MSYNNRNPYWDRIEQIIEHYKFPTVSAFGKHIGVNHPENLYQIKRGNNRISPDLAERIGQCFPEVSKAWILTGEGSMFADTPARTILTKIVGVPFYENFPKNRPPFEPDKILYFSRELVNNADFAVRCRTDELVPLYPKDSIVFMRRCALRNPIVYGEVYFVKTDYCGLFRIVRKGEAEDEICLVGPNKEKYDEVRILVGDVRELYIVIE